MATASKAKKTLDQLSSPRLNAKQAVEVAGRYFHDLFPEQAKANMMLEEIEESEDGKNWLITLGYDADHQLRHLLESARLRAYKRFTIDQESGRIISVRIRTLD